MSPSSWIARFHFTFAELNRLAFLNSSFLPQHNFHNMVLSFIIPVYHKFLCAFLMINYAVLSFITHKKIPSPYVQRKDFNRFGFPHILLLPLVDGEGFEPLWFFPTDILLLMDGEGFEPSKALPTDLQSAPFGHSGIHPNIRNMHLPVRP